MLIVMRKLQQCAIFAVDGKQEAKLKQRGKWVNKDIEIHELMFAISQ